MKNNEYPTWLVPLEIAKELKAIGFNEPCLVTYKEVFDEEMIFISFEGDDYCYYYAELSECSQRTNSEMGKDILKTGKHYSYACSIPTWTDVLAWFRKKNLVGLVSYRYRDKNNKGFSFEILDEDTDVFLYNTYEQAQEALVYKLIEIYKSEQNESLHIRKD